MASNLNQIDSFVRNLLRSTNERREDVNCFLLCFRKYLTVLELLDIWKSECKSVIEEFHSSRVQQLESLCEFMLLWLEKFFMVDFLKKQIRMDLLHFVDTVKLPRQNEFKLLLIRLNNKRGSCTICVRNRSLSNVRNPQERENDQTENNLTSVEIQNSTKNTESKQSEDKKQNGVELPIRRSSLSVAREINSPDFEESISIAEISLSPSGSLESNSTTYRDVLAIMPALVANSLTRQTFALFASVEPMELMTQIRWNQSQRTSSLSSGVSSIGIGNEASSSKEKSSGRVEKLAQRFNQVARWVATEIVIRKNRKKRVALIERFIEIAKKCDSLNNFETMFAILSGLTNSSVQRMKKTWSSVSDKYMKEFQTLNSLFDIGQNFKCYRNELCLRKRPVIPHFALVLRDLTFFNENPPFLPDGSINIELIRQLGRSIHYIESLQAHSYKLPVMASVDEFLKEMAVIEDNEDLYRASMETEPSTDSNLVSFGSSKSLASDSSQFS